MKEIIKNKLGFTLIELLIVISIIGILTIISASSFRNAQIKAKDAQRKSDLDGLSKALMMYYSDNGIFPNLTDLQLFGNKTVGLTGINGIVYMRETPKDPKDVLPYKYVYKIDPTFKSFNLFANLENKQDSQCGAGYSVGTGTTYCYGVTSPNAVVKNW